MNEFTCSTLINGVVASLIASLIVVIFSQFKKFGTKKNIQLYIEYIKGCHYQLETAIGFNDYNIAVQQADNIMQSILRIYDLILPLTFLRTKKRLVYTFCYNIFLYMDRVKMVSRGCPDLQVEHEFRCKKLQDYLGNETNIAYNDWVTHSISILDELVKHNGYRNAFIKIYERFPNNNILTIVQPQTFQEEKSIAPYLKKNIMSKAEYTKIVNKVLKTYDLCKKAAQLRSTFAVGNRKRNV